ncbi:HEAT repeat domain-containing protein [Gimesia panareensis]|uniref:Uncharacterized protein n=1 Tax=Gimesia panareensis TaxID=2527978 RepID=A0A517Q147_9PLAN|nr:HEAT repeat domain-containing protein [Gimesia panareensis]QDT25360.1 hypothetical protein Enr10x_06550 [Gimesia panareensis]QDU48320.1 hypothetical protein Pan110_06330 [Gimesia panareensis]
MNPADFAKFVQQLRSQDSQTYEDGYQSISGRVDEVLAPLIQLAESESPGQMRGRFVELIGQSETPEAIEFLAGELQSPSKKVRMWAYSGLADSESSVANAIAAKFKDENPEEEFL